MEDVGSFYVPKFIWSIFRPFGQFSDHLVYFMAIWYIFWLFGIFCGHLYWDVVPRKIWQPWNRRCQKV
jgi:hypothetical protein